MEELGPNGSLGKHPILMSQVVTGATHRQGQYLLLGAQAPGQNNPRGKEEGFEECLGIPQAA